MSSFTTRIRLEKQTPGQNSNTWGTVLNDNVISLIDDSIAAYTTITVSSVNVTLTQADGSADQARSAFLDISGTLTGNVNVIRISVLYVMASQYVTWKHPASDPHQTWLMYLWRPPQLTLKSPWQFRELFLSQGVSLYLVHPLWLQHHSPVTSP